MSKASHPNFQRKKFAIYNRVNLSRLSAQTADKAIQPKRSRADAPQLDPHRAVQIQSLRLGGKPLAKSTREFFEPRFGRDFSQVRVHDDRAAVDAAETVRARAYTLGSDIVFNSGQYAPTTGEGRRLLAHELAHTVQQTRSGSAIDPGVDRAAGIVQRAGDPNQAPPDMPCPIAENTVVSMLDVHFDRNSAAIRPVERAALEDFVVSWNNQPDSPRIRVDGHASEEGSEPHNWPLSCERAVAVQNVLTSATSSGSPGIPSGFVEVKAAGETVELGPSLHDNRVATVSSEAPAAAPTPAPAPPPAFRCGPDVTAELQAAVARTRTAFGGWSATEREEHCDALDSYRTGGYAWDIVELHNNAWIHLNYRPACATAGATPPCGSTVQVDSDCNYAGSPNYVIYGVMCDLCHGHYVSTGNTGGQRRFTQAEMLSWIDFYKGPGVFSAASGNYRESRLWAIAGYSGWPGAASPPGDRPGCDPSCPTPHTTPSFTVAWWRNPGILSDPTRTEI